MMQCVCHSNWQPIKIMFSFKICIRKLVFSLMLVLFPKSLVRVCIINLKYKPIPESNTITSKEVFLGNNQICSEIHALGNLRIFII